MWAVFLGSPLQDTGGRTGAQQSHQGLGPSPGHPTVLSNPDCPCHTFLGHRGAWTQTCHSHRATYYIKPLRIRKRRSFLRTLYYNIFPQARVREHKVSVL